MTEGVRPCTIEDVPRIADLFESVFRRRTAPAPASLRDYFEAIYFGHPWRDERLSSLVYQLADGRIVGFMGSLPLRLRFRGESLLGAVAGNLMVHRDFKNPLAGARLVKTFLGGPQDLSFSDTANEISRKMWEAAGGMTLLLPSLQWLCVLRPGGFALHMLHRKLPRVPFKGFARLVVACMDTVVGKVGSPSGHELPAGFASAVLDRASHLAGLGPILRKYALAPDYDAYGLGWLMDRAAEKSQFGPLRGAVLRGPGGALCGWHLYYGQAGGLAHVLQLCAVPAARKLVLSSVIADARERGCVALMGAVEPHFMRELADEQSIFVLRGGHAVAHSRREDVRRAVADGDAFLGRLEGEWWTRLQGDVFN